MTTNKNPTSREGRAELTANNHELMKLVRARIEEQYPLGFIAQELEVELQDLIDWIMDVYKPPRRDKPMANAKYGPAIGETRNGGGAGWSLSAQVRRQTAWERQRAGARKAMAE